MAFVLDDRIYETTTTTGTGPVTLDGAETAYQAFGDALSNKDKTYYTIAHQTADEWETGIGTWGTGGILTRTTVVASSNGDAAVNFSAGTKDVYCSQLASKAVYVDSDGNCIVSALAVNTTLTVFSVPFTAVATGAANNDTLVTQGYVDATASTPGGADTNVQFNDATAFGGQANFAFNKATGVLTVNSDSTAQMTFGRALIGGDGGAFGDYMWVSHIDMSAASQYAMLQSNLGDTFINAASGRSLFLRLANSTVMTAFNGRIGVGNGATSPVAMLEVQAATASVPGVVVKSTDDSQTNPTFEIQTSAGTPYIRVVKNRLEWLNSGNNVHIGYEAGLNDDLANNSNMHIGYQAGLSTTTGTWSLNLGYRAGRTAVTASTNVYMGHDSGYGATNIGNTCLGAFTMFNSTTGYYNVCLGYNSGRNISSGWGNVAIGYNALATYNSSVNIAIGKGAFQLLQGNYNIGIGVDAGQQLNQTIYRNFFMGYGCGKGVAGNAPNDNNILGYLGVTGITTGSRNVGQGTEVLKAVTSANDNVCQGYRAGWAISDGDENVFIGNTTGHTQVTGNHCILIGHNIDVAASSTSNYLSIGNVLFATGMDGSGTTVSAANVGLMSKAPDRKLELNVGASTDGIRISYNQDSGSATDYADLLIDSDGGLTINTTEDIHLKPTGNTTLGDGGTSNYVEVDATGDVVFQGTSGLAYGEISVQGSAATITLNSGSGYVQVTSFDTNGDSNNSTPDHTNDHITITKAGRYLITCSMTVANQAGAAHTVTVHCEKNNGATTIANLTVDRTMGTGTDHGSLSMSGIHNFAANDTLELWATTDRAINSDVEFHDICLSVVQIGGPS